ncbi:hypothetical protein F4809DRAFT_625643 [Biscogniauxia mediterranea]|nr:hypothetical protein F4809DRAFT_625643 [Biscogniauxia mediterranea]
MQPSAALSLVAAALLSAAQAADEPFLGPLAPFEVSALSAPCGAGAASSDNVAFTVANPNRVTAGRSPHAEGGGYWSFENSTARCAGSCAEVSSPASSSSALWSFRVSSTTTTNGTGAAREGFDVGFTLVYNVTRWGGVYYKVLEGTGRFVVGEQLVQRGGGGDDGDDDDGGSVGGAAGCELVLADGAAPVLVPPTITDCKGTC